MSSTRKSILRYHHGNTEATTDVIAVEEPLEIRIEGESVAVIMRSPNTDNLQEDIELVTGFLCTEGVIQDITDIHAIQHIVDPCEPRYNTVDVVLSSGVPAKRKQSATEHVKRNLYASSSCGICGKATQDRIFQQFPPLLSKKEQVDLEKICNLPTQLRMAQANFQQTGGTHAAMLFDGAYQPLYMREDIGRHNAVDKVIGALLREDIPAGDCVLLVSGRVAFEIAQKALAVQIPIIVSIGAPSSMAVDFCAKANIRLVGFVKEHRCNIYV